MEISVRKSFIFDTWFRILYDRVAKALIVEYGRPTEAKSESYIEQSYLLSLSSH